METLNRDPGEAVGGDAFVALCSLDTKNLNGLMRTLLERSDAARRDLAALHRRCDAADERWAARHQAGLDDLRTEATDRARRDAAAADAARVEADAARAAAEEAWREAAAAAARRHEARRAQDRAEHAAEVAQLASEQQEALRRLETSVMQAAAEKAHDVKCAAAKAAARLEARVGANRDELAAEMKASHDCLTSLVEAAAAALRDEAAAAAQKAQRRCAAAVAAAVDEAATPLAAEARTLAERVEAAAAAAASAAAGVELARREQALRGDALAQELAAHKEKAAAAEAAAAAAAAARAAEEADRVETVRAELQTLVGAAREGAVLEAQGLAEAAAAAEAAERQKLQQEVRAKGEAAGKKVAGLEAKVKTVEEGTLLRCVGLSHELKERCGGLREACDGAVAALSARVCDAADAAARLAPRVDAVAGDAAQLRERQTAADDRADAAAAAADERATAQAARAARAEAAAAERAAAAETALRTLAEEKASTRHVDAAVAAVAAALEAHAVTAADADARAAEAARQAAAELRERVEMLDKAVRHAERRTAQRCDADAQQAEARLAEAVTQTVPRMVDDAVRPLAERVKAAAKEAALLLKKLSAAERAAEHQKVHDGSRYEAAMSACRNVELNTSVEAQRVRESMATLQRVAEGVCALFCLDAGVAQRAENLSVDERVQQMLRTPVMACLRAELEESAASFGGRPPPPPPPQAAASYGGRSQGASFLSAADTSASTGLLTSQQQLRSPLQHAAVESFGATVQSDPGQRGCTISHLTPHGDCERGGLRVGDRLLYVNGIKVDTSLDLTQAVSLARPSASMKATYIPWGAEEPLTVDIPLGATGRDRSYVLSTSPALSARSRSPPRQPSTGGLTTCELPSSIRHN